MFRNGNPLLFLDLQQRFGWYKHCKLLSTSIKTVQEVTIPVPWGHVAGKWWGNPDMQPVLGFHGRDDNCGTFDTLIPHLNFKSFLALDLIGHGISSYYPMGSTHHFLDAVVLVRRIVNHYNWNKLNFIGHSFGSAMGFLYSALYPNEVEKFVSIDCARTLMMPDDSLQEETQEILDKTLDIEKKMMSSDPPGYSYEELLDRLYKGGLKSPTRSSCAVLLNRGMKKTPVDDRPHAVPTELSGFPFQPV